MNHCALTARVAEAARVAIRGFVLSHVTRETDPSSETNAATIADLTGLRCLGVVPHLARPEDAAGLLTLP